MKHSWMFAVAITTAFATTGCESNDEAYVAALREAVAKADSSLADSVKAAENDGAAPVSGELSVKGEMFSVRAVAQPDLKRFRFALDGEAVGVDVIGASPSGDCSHAISASEAIAIAEADQNGTATGIEQEYEDDDDDVPCTWEVQVLTPNELMEVEVGPDGTVLETELSDEDGTGEDDDDD